MHYAIPLNATFPATKTAKDPTPLRLPVEPKSPNPTNTLERIRHSELLCTRGSVVIHDIAAGTIQIVPLRCKLWTCPTCSPFLRWQWTQKIALAKPRRFITLTCQPDHFDSPEAAYQRMKIAFAKLVTLLREKLGPFEYCAVWELHKSGWPHLHVAQKGVYIPFKFLRAAWTYLGCGTIVHIREIDKATNAASYIAKYMGKEIPETVKRLGLTRLVQSSRDFFEKKLLVEKAPAQNTEVLGWTRSHPATLALEIINGLSWYLDVEKSQELLTITIPPDVNKSTLERLLSHYISCLIGPSPAPGPP